MTVDAVNMQPQRQQSEGPVLIVHGLNTSKVNADGLFNLLCLYGNVDKIMFVASEPGSTMVQMSDPQGTERAARRLDNAQLFRSVVQIVRTTLASVHASSKATFKLPDGTESINNFVDSVYNRFSRPADASRNHITLPSQWVHFFNAPGIIIDHDIRVCSRSSAVLRQCQSRCSPRRQDTPRPASFSLRQCRQPSKQW